MHSKALQNAGQGSALSASRPQAIAIAAVPLSNSALDLVGSVAPIVLAACPLLVQERQVGPEDKRQSVLGLGFAALGGKKQL